MGPGRLGDPRQGPNVLRILDPIQRDEPTPDARGPFRIDQKLTQGKFRQRPHPERDTLVVAVGFDPQLEIRPVDDLDGYASSPGKVDQLGLIRPGSSGANEHAVEASAASAQRFTNRMEAGEPDRLGSTGSACARAARFLAGSRHVTIGPISPAIRVTGGTNIPRAGQSQRTSIALNGSTASRKGALSSIFG